MKALKSLIRVNGASSKLLNQIASEFFRDFGYFPGKHLARGLVDFFEPILKSTLDNM